MKDEVASHLQDSRQYGQRLIQSDEEIEFISQEEQKDFYERGRFKNQELEKEISKKYDFIDKITNEFKTETLGDPEIFKTIQKNYQIQKSKEEKIKKQKQAEIEAQQQLFDSINDSVQHHHIYPLNTKKSPSPHNLQLQLSGTLKQPHHQQQPTLQRPKKPKQLNSFEKQYLKELNDMGNEEDNLLREDLNWVNMARYKTLKNGDIIRNDLITNQALRRRSIRKIVLDSDISDLSEVESNYQEQNYRSQSKARDHHDLQKQPTTQLKSYKTQLYSTDNDNDDDDPNSNVSNQSKELHHKLFPKKQQSKQQSRSPSKVRSKLKKQTSKNKKEQKKDHSKTNTKQKAYQKNQVSRNSLIESFDSKASRYNFWKEIHDTDFLLTAQKIDEMKKQKSLIGQAGKSTAQQTQHYSKSQHKISNQRQMVNQQYDTNHTSEHNDPLLNATFIDYDQGYQKNFQDKSNTLKNKDEVIKVIRKNTAPDPNYIDPVKNQEMIRKMKAAHQQQVKNVKKLAIVHAVDYFKHKAVDLNTLFTQETINQLNQFQEIRQRVMNEISLMEGCQKNIIEQEKIISFQRTFYAKTLHQVHQKSKQNYKLIKDLFYQKFSRPLDEKEAVNPFFLYNQYIDLVEPVEQQQNLNYFKDHFHQAKQHNESLLNEMDTLKNTCEIFINEEQKMRKEITILKTELEAVKIEKQKEIDTLKEKLVEVQKEQEYEKRVLEDNIKSLKEVAVIENQCRDAIIDKQREHVRILTVELNKIKMILRTPRLYEQYKKQLEQEQVQETLKQFIQEKLEKIEQAQEQRRKQEEKMARIQQAKEDGFRKVQDEYTTEKALSNKTKSQSPQMNTTLQQSTIVQNQNQNVVKIPSHYKVRSKQNQSPNIFNMVKSNNSPIQPSNQNISPQRQNLNTISQQSSHDKITGHQNLPVDGSNAHHPMMTKDINMDSELINDPKQFNKKQTQGEFSNIQVQYHQNLNNVQSQVYNTVTSTTAAPYKKKFLNVQSGQTLSTHNFKQVGVSSTIVNTQLNGNKKHVTSQLHQPKTVKHNQSQIKPIMLFSPNSQQAKNQPQDGSNMKQIQTNPSAVNIVKFKTPVNNHSRGGGIQTSLQQHHQKFHNTTSMDPRVMMTQANNNQNVHQQPQNTTQQLNIHQVQMHQAQQSQGRPRNTMQLHSSIGSNPGSTKYHHRQVASQHNTHSRQYARQHGNLMSAMPANKKISQNLIGDSSNKNQLIDLVTGPDSGTLSPVTSQKYTQPSKQDIFKNSSYASRKQLKWTRGQQHPWNYLSMSNTNFEEKKD